MKVYYRLQLYDVVLIILDHLAIILDHRPLLLAPFQVIVLDSFITFFTFSANMENKRFPRKKHQEKYYF